MNDLMPDGISNILTRALNISADYLSTEDYEFGWTYLESHSSDDAMKNVPYLKVGA